MGDIFKMCGLKFLKDKHKKSHIKIVNITETSTMCILCLRFLQTSFLTFCDADRSSQAEIILRELVM